MMLLTGGNRYAAQELWLRKRCAHPPLINPPPPPHRHPTLSRFPTPRHTPYRQTHTQIEISGDPVPVFPSPPHANMHLPDPVRGQVDLHRRASAPRRS
jgi:hypothetical protein